MPKLPYSPLFKHKPRGRHLLALAIVVIYLLVWLSARVHDIILPQSLLLVPIFTFAILYGFWGGIVAGVLFWPVHILLLAPATGIEARLTAAREGWVAYIIFLSFGVFIGYLKELIDRLQRENEEHQLTQLALEKQIHQNQLMLNTMLDGYVLTDTEGRILHVNPAYCAITGYSAEELLQMDIYEIGVQLSDEEISQRIQEIISRGGARFETKHLHKNGTLLDLDLSIALMQTEEEPLLAAFIRDITARKQAQRKLQEYAEQLEEMVEERTLALKQVQEKLLQQERLATLGRLASGVSHELRNPLAVIANAVYYLKLVQTNATPTIIEYLNLIDSEIKAATHIIAELQDFAKKPLAQRKAVILTEAVAEALQHRPIPPHIQTHIQIPADLRPVFVDPEHLARLLDELIQNACDAMDEGGELQISAALEEGEEQPFIRLDIADTGTGLTPEAQKHAFEPLFSTKARGIGLGLTLCQALVAANSGRISLRPGPKQGAIASLWFPAVLLDMYVSQESGENT